MLSAKRGGVVVLGVVVLAAVVGSGMVLTAMMGGGVVPRLSAGTEVVGLEGGVRGRAGAVGVEGGGVDITWPYS